MERKIILFSINTEFVFLVALLYYEIYKSKTHHPVWLFLYTSEKRFKNLNLDNLQGEKYFFKDELNSFKKKVDLSFVQIIESMEVDEFVMQNNYKISNLIILSKLKKCQLNKVFISDSIGLNVKRSLLFMLRQNAYLNFRKFFNGYLTLPLSQYEALNYLKKIDTYINDTPIKNVNANFIAFKELFLHLNQSKWAKNIFKVDLITDYDIYLFTQPINKVTFTKEIAENYSSVINQIAHLAKSNNKKLLIKVHPGESHLKYKHLESENCKLYRDSNSPAELLFFNIDKKIILSCFSSVSTLDYSGNNNEHYWFYPLVKHTPKFSGDNSIVNIIKNKKELKKIMLKQNNAY